MPADNRKVMEPQRIALDTINGWDVSTVFIPDIFCADEHIQGHIETIRFSNVKRSTQIEYGRTLTGSLPTLDDIEVALTYHKQAVEDARATHNHDDPRKDRW